MIATTATLIGRPHIHLGKGVRIGHYTVIEATEDAPVHIGAGTTIGHHCTIRPGTRIGDRCVVDDGCRFSGNCMVENEVTLRYETIVARGTVLGSGTYCAPRVMFNNRDAEGRQYGGATVGRDCFIGTHTVVQHGVDVERETTIGAMSFVNRSITEPGGTWVGIPAKRIR